MIKNENILMKKFFFHLKAMSHLPSPEAEIIMAFLLLWIAQ